MSVHTDAERSRRLRQAAQQEAELREAFEQACRSERDWLLAQRATAKGGAGGGSRKHRPAGFPPPTAPDFGMGFREAAGREVRSAGRRRDSVGSGNVFGAGSGGAVENSRHARADVTEQDLAVLLDRLAADDEAALNSDPARALRNRLARMLTTS